jgi:RNA polymerase sigma-70 factor (ECF subfamily)
MAQHQAACRPSAGDPRSPRGAEERSGDPPEPVIGAAGALSFGDVYATHFRFVWRSLRRLGVDEAAIDDAVQEVFLVVHRRLTDFEPRFTVRAWLFRILSRIARDQKRTWRRKSPGAQGTGVCEPDTVPDHRMLDPLENAERAEAVRLLHRVLEELDDDKREVFVLMDLEEMSAPEVAQALGIPVNTAYSRLRVARLEFDQALARLRAPLARSKR